MTSQHALTSYALGWRRRLEEMAATGRTVQHIDQATAVAYEDQQKINLFARKNARLVDLQEQIAAKKKELQNLEDASDDLLLVDDQDYTPYQIGEVFIHMSDKDTQEYLEKGKTELQKELKTLQANADEINGVLSDLKVQLYAKFGDSINLEVEDS